MNEADLVRLVERLEDEAASYITLDAVQAAYRGDVAAAIDSGLLLVDYRTGLDGSAVTLCRLNRHHPLVAEMTGW